MGSTPDAGALRSNSSQIGDDMTHASSSSSSSSLCFFPFLFGDKYDDTHSLALASASVSRLRRLPGGGPLPPPFVSEDFFDRDDWGQRNVALHGSRRIGYHNRLTVNKFENK
jgi:hypothetical protein